MTETADVEFAGTHGKVAVRRRTPESPNHIALIAHGYGEHAGRYGHVASALVASGAAVYAPDHVGHGRSDGDRARLELVEDMVTDLHAVADMTRADHPGVPLVLIGHSMGGLVATRYAQRYGADEIDALVLSGPAIGANPGFAALLEMDPMPDVPVDPEVLSRDLSVGEAYLGDPLVYHGTIQRASLVGYMELIEAVADGHSLGSIPTLWLHGAEDALVPIDGAREALSVIRGDRLDEKIYEGARHEVFNETNNNEVIGDMITFITDALSK